MSVCNIICTDFEQADCREYIAKQLVAEIRGAFNFQGQLNYWIEHLDSFILYAEKNNGRKGLGGNK